MFVCRFFRFVGRAVGDSGLYYVLCDKGCLMADKALSRARLFGRRAPIHSSHRLDATPGQNRPGGI